MKNNSSLKMTLLKGRTFIVLALLIVFFSVASPNFLTTNTLLLLAKHVALYGILAIGMTYVIITGGIDLSVGAVVGLAGMIAGGMIPKLESCVEAIEAGVQRVHLVDGRMPHSLLLEIFTKQGVGTEIKADE